MKRHALVFGFGLVFVVSFVVGVLSQDRRRQAPVSEFNDVHLHLTNYIQEGTDIRDFVKLMGAKVGRSALFGIPLQQQWSYRVDGVCAPAYYLQSDAPLYYY